MKKWLLTTATACVQIIVFAQQEKIQEARPQAFIDGIRYLSGLGTNYDPAKAVQVFRESAARGDGASSNALGNLFAKGEAGLEKNVDSAIAYYLMAGQKGYSTGYYNLAMIYREGNEITQDFSKSAMYLQEGTKMGNLNCKKLLAYY